MCDALDQSNKKIDELFEKIEDIYSKVACLNTCVTWMSGMISKIPLKEEDKAHKSSVLYKGKPIEEMSREELMDALQEAGKCDKCAAKRMIMDRWSGLNSVI